MESEFMIDWPLLELFEYSPFSFKTHYCTNQIFFSVNTLSCSIWNSTIHIFRICIASFNFLFQPVFWSSEWNYRFWRFHSFLILLSQWILFCSVGVILYLQAIYLIDSMKPNLVESGFDLMLRNLKTLWNTRNYDSMD